VSNEEWRVEVDLDDEGYGSTLRERLRAHDLDDEARQRLGRRVIVTRDGPRLYFYAADEAAAREAERVARELLEAERLTGTVRVVRWDAPAEEWLAADTADEAHEHPYEWEVHVDLPGRQEARELEGRLGAEGLPVHRLWRWVTIDTRTEDDADDLAQRLVDELPDGVEVHVQPNPEGIPSPAFVWLETRV
jgi:hypothetical protein